MVKVLILGGAGFLGYHLGSYLARQPGYRITIVDNLSRGQIDVDLKEFLSQSPMVEMVMGDLTDPEIWGRTGGPFDHVYLLAGIVGVRRVETQPAGVIRTNVAIILNTLEWLARVGCGRILFASTSETYSGAVELGVVSVPTREDVPLAVLDIKNPRSTYAVTKILGETAAIHYAQSYGFEGVIVRYHNIYGPRMGFDHVVPELMERIWRQVDPLPVYGLEQTRAFCYVTDAVRASRALMECNLDRCETVNIGNDQEEIIIKDLLEKLLDLINFHPAIDSLPAPAGAVSRRCPNLDKLRSLTGFYPQVNVDSGLVQTWDWYRQHLGEKESSLQIDSTS